MVRKRGIPKEILEELDVYKKEDKKPEEVLVIVEKHQAKIPIPIKIRINMELKKGVKCKMDYNKVTKRLTCQF